MPRSSATLHGSVPPVTAAATLTPAAISFAAAYGVFAVQSMSMAASLCLFVSSATA